MVSNDWCDAETTALLQAVLRLRTLSEAARFFRDLMTEHELLEIRNRWLAARLLHGGIRYKTIEARTGMSSRTLARIAHWIRQGEGGYALMLKRLDPGATRGRPTRRPARRRQARGG